jgi:hypothetical protein
VNQKTVPPQVKDEFAGELQETLCRDWLRNREPCDGVLSNHPDGLPVFIVTAAEVDSGQDEELN